MLVLFRISENERTDYFPFRKRELVERLSDEQPFAIAAAALTLPEKGANALTRRISRIPLSEGEELNLSRLALVNDKGDLIGIGVPREKRQEDTAYTAFLESGSETRTISSKLEMSRDESLIDERLSDEEERKQSPPKIPQPRA